MSTVTGARVLGGCSEYSISQMADVTTMRTVGTSFDPPLHRVYVTNIDTSAGPTLEVLDENDPPRRLAPMMFCMQVS